MIASLGLGLQELGWVPQARGRSGLAREHVGPHRIFVPSRRPTVVELVIRQPARLIRVAGRRPQATALYLDSARPRRARSCLVPVPVPVCHRLTVASPESRGHAGRQAGSRPRGMSAAQAVVALALAAILSTPAPQADTYSNVPPTLSGAYLRSC